MKFSIYFCDNYSNIFFQLSVEFLGVFVLFCFFAVILLNSNPPPFFLIASTSCFKDKIYSLISQRVLIIVVIIILGIFLPAEFLFFPSRFLVVYFSFCLFSFSSLQIRSFFQLSGY